MMCVLTVTTAPRYLLTTAGNYIKSHMMKLHEPHHMSSQVFPSPTFDTRYMTGYWTQEQWTQETGLLET